MNKARKKCIGIDLTQQRPMVAIAEGTKIIEYKTLADTPPAALLPIVHGESIIAGVAAHKHRRGTGSVWPPECQAPVYANSLNGVGRIPLVCAWQKLAKRSAKSFSGFLGDTEIGWRPTGQKELTCSAERLIAESVTSWKKKNFSNSKAAIIIPDSLGEAAQQALIDHCDAFLTPRPVAVALSWCRNNVNNFNGLGEDSEEGTAIGHLVVITMAFDQWEVVPIEIRAKIFAEKLWLVPVRNRTAIGGEIPRTGVGLFTGISLPDRGNVDEVWEFVFGSDKASRFADGKMVLAREQINALREYTRLGWTNRDRNYFSSWDIWKDLYAVSSNMEIDKLKKEIISLYRQQLQCLNNDAAEQCLGVVIDGACARVRITEEKRFGDIIASAFENYKIEIADGFEAVRGAAYTIAALGKGLPCYRETILPIEIHYRRHNEQGDLINDWKMLIKGTTVRAGSEYISPAPVEGLKIEQGGKILELTLRRPSGKGEYIHRKVSAEGREEIRQDEPVRISANLRPGQGFAKVAIDSVHEGIFNALLNWRTMKPCDPPAKPKLAYLPQVSILKHDKEMWDDAKFSLNESINALSYDISTLLISLKQLREGHLNKWPSADSVDQFRNRRLKGDIFLHYSVFPSDGNLEDVTSPHLARKFIEECESYFLRRGISPKKKDAVQRIASWSYLACPSTIIESVRQNLKRNMAATSQVDLHTIGLCFEKPADVKIFFAALEKLFQLRHSGINEWLRTIRNIVRFRDHALQPEIISKSRLKNIISGLLRSLKGEVKASNFAHIYNNCILAILYLLKRRRYEPDFMTAEDELYKRVDYIFSAIINKKSNRLSHRQFEIVSIVLRFLHREASQADLKGILMEV